MNILALDLATKTGWARGTVGGTPRWGSIGFAKPYLTENAPFGRALLWLEAMLGGERPDMLVLEGLLPPTVKIGATTTNVRDRLAGLHGIARAVAFRKGVHTVQYPVGDVRQHFIGARTVRRQRAKAETVERCHQLGWMTSDDKDEDAADALALWDYTCCIIDPKLGIRRTPLFWHPGAA